MPHPISTQTPAQTPVLLYSGFTWTGVVGIYLGGHRAAPLTGRGNYAGQEFRCQFQGREVWTRGAYMLDAGEDLPVRDPEHARVWGLPSTPEEVTMRERILRHAEQDVEDLEHDHAAGKSWATTEDLEKARQDAAQAATKLEEYRARLAS